MKPIELIHTPAGEQVFDLGQEITGIFKFHVKEPVGTEILIQTGEVLQDGNFYNGNLRTAKSEYHYISDGTEKEIVPHFTYYGYRYVKVSGVTNLSCDDFTALVLCSDYEKTGRLETGHELVNQLISNVEWGMRGNFLDVPTDCPQRDERMGWTGDTQVFSATASYLADTYAFYRKFLYDMYQEQLLTDGMVPEVVPTFGPSKTSCAWGDAACIIPWNVYLFSGDKTILEQQIDSMKAWVDYIRKVDGEHHGWRNSFHYGDWLALDRPGAKEGNVYGATDEAYIADVYYAASAQIVAKAAGVLGKSELQKEYQEIADQQWKVVKDEYFTATGRCAIKTQTGLTLALKYHLSENETMTAKMLKTLFRQNKYKLNTGFIGTPLLCNILTENGMSDIAYQLLLNEEFPGWLYEVKLGATTVWERWNSLDESGHVSSTGMNSLNHYSYGAVLEWVYRHAAGIDVTEQNPGGRKMKIYPKINAELGYVDASYDSACGTYQSSWKILDGNKIQLRFFVPFGCEAEISLPYAPDSVYEEKDFLIPHDAFLEEKAYRQESYEEENIPDVDIAEEKTPSNQYKLLIIEDDNDVREFLKEEFKPYFEVVTEADGLSGLERARTYDADLIICDVLMPGLTGFEVTRKLKNDFDTSHIPIILLTAMSSAENHLKGVESGADAYITKPFSPKLLLARAFQLIKQREKLRKKFSDDPGMITPAICTSEKDKQFADKLQAILEEQISNSEFAVDDLASVMGLGRSTFYRKVRGITGYSPNEYMRIIRMKKAAELLLENRYTVAEVSYKIGIEDPFYFSKCFKKQFGVSPSVYLRGKNDPDITIQTIQNDFPT